MIAAVVLLALLVGVAVQLATSAGAEGITITRVAAARDAMGVDYDRNGNAVNTKYHIADHTLSVGETPGDGHDARALLPFWITDEMRDVAKDGGTATVSVKVWKVENLGPRKVALEAFTTDSVAPTDFKRDCDHALRPHAGRRQDRRRRDEPRAGHAREGVSRAAPAARRPRPHRRRDHAGDDRCRPRPTSPRTVRRSPSPAR